LAYVSDEGVNLVSFSGDDWSNVTYLNQWLLGSEYWTFSGEPLSRGLEELQIEAMSVEPGQLGYMVVWSRISTLLFEAEPIWTFEPLEARFISHVHPGDPTRFIRVDKRRTGGYQGRAIASDS
jgi:hypothetical protein